MSTNLIWALIITSIILLTIWLFPQIMWATGSFNINESSARYVFLGLSLAGLLGMFMLLKSTSKLSPESPKSEQDIAISSPILNRVVKQYEPQETRETQEPQPVVKGYNPLPTPLTNAPVEQYQDLPKSSETSGAILSGPTNLPPPPPPITRV
jgi:hypothetical protein